MCSTQTDPFCLTLANMFRNVKITALCDKWGSKKQTPKWWAFRDLVINGATRLWGHFQSTSVVHRRHRKVYFFTRRLINMNVRYTTFLCPSQIQRSKPEIRKTALSATRGGACL